MAGEELSNEIDIETLNLELSLFERRCRADDLWLVDVMRKELPDATSGVLNYFLEILQQEREIKISEGKNEWFCSPDETIEFDQKLGEIYECVKTLKEYKIDLDSLVISDDGKNYSVGLMADEASELSIGMFEKLYSCIKIELKKAEMLANIRIIKLSEQGGEGRQLDLNLEDELPDKLPFAEAECLEEIVEEVPVSGIFSAKDLENELGDPYKKYEEKKDRPKYWDIEVTNAMHYFDKVPKIKDVAVLNKFLLNNEEKATLMMANGKNKIKRIIENSPMKPGESLNFIVYMIFKGVLAYPQK